MIFKAPSNPDHSSTTIISRTYLGVSEMSLKHLPNILGMGEIKGCIHFIQDVNWGRPEEEHGQYQG